MKNSASIKVTLYIHKTLKNGQHPIIIQIIKDRKIKKISIGYSAKKDEWDFTENKPSKKHPLRKELETVINMKMAILSKQVLALELQSDDYSAETVVKRVQRKKASTSIIGFFDEVIVDLRKNNRIGNADIYQTCKNVINTFINGKDLAFIDVVPIPT